ncbi:MAG: hypothetical protein QM753_15230 [Thermomicrobiales bacterium]
MSDTQPIFTDDDSVEREIEANEARDTGPKETTIERTLDKVISPIARLFADDELTPEEAAEVRRENDRDHQPA